MPHAANDDAPSNQQVHSMFARILNAHAAMPDVIARARIASEPCTWHVWVLTSEGVELCDVCGERK